MGKAASYVALAVALATTGCVSLQQFLDQNRDKAMQAALNRGKFELGCTEASGQVLSQDMVQPAVFGGIQRAEYTIGVQGCGKKGVYIAICPEGGDGCFVTDSGPYHRF